MFVGVPKEIKANEYRVGLTPSSVQELVSRGHQVGVETNCGQSIGFTDEVYREVGARILPNAAAVYEAADMVVKVKEPQPSECAMLRQGQLLFTYLHLAADPLQTEGLVKSGVSAIAYETITDVSGTLPLLLPMSEVAGRLSVQVGATYLERFRGGRGVLLSGVPGVAAATVVILGCGISGSSALKMAYGMGAHCIAFERSVARLREIEDQYPHVITQYSTAASIEAVLPQADLVIGAVLVPGRAAPKLIQREHLAMMKPGAVLVDVAIDQGGCFATSTPTTHEDPVYVIDDVVHYCVANMPGAVPRTSSAALNNVTLPYVLRLADQGLDALRHDSHFLHGLNVHQGHITYQPVAVDLNLTYVPAEEVLL